MKKVLYFLIFIILCSFTLGANSWDTADWIWNLEVDNTDLVGNTIVDTQGNYNGTNVGATTGATGQINQAFTYNGTNYVDTNFGITIADGQPLHISSWVKATTLAGADRTIIAFQDSDATPRINLRFDDGHGFRFQAYDDVGAGMFIDSNLAPTTNKWYLISVDFDGTDSWKMFINGSITDGGTATQATGSFTPFGSFWIGANHDEDNDKRGWIGQIDQTDWWNQSLNGTQINDSLKQGVDGFRLDYTAPLIITLTNPINKSTYYYTESNLFDGYINLTTTINANCSINDSTWSTILTGNTIHAFYNITPLVYKNFSLEVSCNDTVNFIKTTFWFNVIEDIINPNITINSGTISSDNKTIISKDLFNFTYNITFADINLFQASINITCDINNSLYNWDILDINTSTYNKVDEFSLENQALQKCNFMVVASDDHTANIIPEYDYNKERNSVSFDTDIANIEISSNDIDDININKLEDRYTFDFNFDYKSLIKIFRLKSDKKLYKRNSDYNGHFVIWSNGKGNWIDFEIETDLDLKYSYQKISDYEWIITIESITPKNIILTPIKKDIFGFPIGEYMTEEETKIETYGLKAVKFKSLGGTNIFNVSYDFYIGGTLNITGINIVNNGHISNWTATMTALTSGPIQQETQTVAGTTAYLTNISNGTYNIEFYHPKFFNQSLKNITINETTYDYNYSSFQAVLNFRFFNTLTDVELPLEGNITLNDTVTGFDYFVNVSSLNLNASNYSILLEYNDFENYTNDNYFINYRENKTLIINISVLADFYFLDELTLKDFNISGADLITFYLLCPDETEQTTITNANQTITIGCKYNKMKVVLDYGTVSYYRNFIFPYSEVFNQSIYLIDLTTTQSIYNSLIIDDLLLKYENPSIYVKKIIGGENRQITADFIDIENKIGAYLIESHEYTIEIHSDNNPVLAIGSYSADSAGAKVISLYDVTIYPGTGNNFLNDVWWNIGTFNDTNTTYARFRYYDRANRTERVTFFLWSDEFNGTQIANYTTTEQDITWIYNISAYPTVYAGLKITHPDLSTHWIGKFLKASTEVLLGIEQFLGKGFLDWVLLILFGALALMATIPTANMTSMMLIGGAGLFVLFGWFGLATGILGLAGLISLLTLIRGGAR